MEAKFVHIIFKNLCKSMVSKLLRGSLLRDLFFGRLCGVRKSSLKMVISINIRLKGLSRRRNIWICLVLTTSCCIRLKFISMRWYVSFMKGLSSIKPEEFLRSFLINFIHWNLILKHCSNRLNLTHSPHHYSHLNANLLYPFCTTSSASNYQPYNHPSNK